MPVDVDIDTPMIAEPVGVESVAIEVLEEGRGNYVVVAVFEREGFCELLGEDEERWLDVVVSGYFVSGQEFFGRDSISLNSELWRHRHGEGYSGGK